MESPEGDVVALAINRTRTFPDRRIVVGSTPLLTETSTVLRLYAESDQRVWELPCPHCSTFFELTWERVQWEPDRPETAHVVCPSCGSILTETDDKPEMVENGRWRATKPDVVGHAGFRLNSLTSLLPSAAWPRLAADFLIAKRSPETLQVFINTQLGQGWAAGGEEIEESDLAARAEPFGLDKIPEGIISISVGVDCADDRLEATICGWDKLGTCFVLGHEVYWGPILDEEVWRDLDELLKTRWPHRSSVLKIDCALIDCGDGGHYDRVLSFTMPKLSRRVFASKGVCGIGRPIVAPTKSRIGNRRLLIVGVDGAKQNIFTKLSANRSAIRFSKNLPPSYYDQLTSERRVVRYSRGRPTIRFERKTGALAEALDALVLATAAHAAVRVNVEAREVELTSPVPPVPTQPRIARSQFMQRGRL